MSVFKKSGNIKSFAKALQVCNLNMEYDAYCRSKLRQKLRTLRHILPYEGRLVRPILP